MGPYFKMLYPVKMLITLNSTEKSAVVELALNARLPDFIAQSCRFKCEYHICPVENYHLLTRVVAGLLSHPLVITCQRCLNDFFYHYDHSTTLAIAYSEELANQLMNVTEYECIVATDNQIDLVEILTDDLYLYLPEKHLDLTQCDAEMSGYVG